ncbi:MAG: GNAT family N-acetyltransferase [Pseudomonadales bacterium]|jgi:predicted N-acyltransferase|nr:GNAT family N-acetyltransferase [Pseudomonadales bacterium]
MSSAETLTLRTVDAIAELPAGAWNACALGGDDPAARRPYNPFLSHAFLDALEASGSAVASRGWQPLHLALEGVGGELLGAVPAYVKSHSQGEYIFDHAWADAFHRAGGSYYPKLLVAVPFTPATGPRLLARGGQGLDVAAVQDALVQGLVEVGDRSGVSSVHVNFPTEAEYRRMGALGLLQRMDQPFHWLNAGYGSFDDFLAELASKKRKNLKRERREALENDIEIEWVTGSDLREHHWDAFYEFYVDTGSRKWGNPYLTRSFFSRIGETMADDVLLILCRRAGRYIAGAINFIGEDTLFGRHWGCIEDHRFLHFETCYYQAIDFAIARGLKRVEAGAQGGHKVARGYLPCATYSAHWIAHPGLRGAVSDYLERERAWVRQDIAHVEERTPFSSRVDIGSIRAAASGARPEQDPAGD